MKLVASESSHWLLTAVLLIVSAPSWAQSVVPSYGNTTTERMGEVQEKLRKVRAVERMARSLSHGLTLLQPITLQTAECGRANASYNPKKRTITLCLELLVLTGSAAREGALASQYQSRSRIAAGAVSFVLLHELGHALIDVLDLPVLGREEDAADQLSIFLLLQRPGRNARFAVLGAMWLFGDTTTNYTQRQLSSAHSLNHQRRSNLACWAIGKDSAAYGWARTPGGLTPQREAACAREYRLLEATVQRLLAPNLQVKPQACRGLGCKGP